MKSLCVGNLESESLEVISRSERAIHIHFELLRELFPVEGLRVHKSRFVRHNLIPKLV